MLLHELDPGTLKKVQLGLTNPKVKSLNAQLDRIHDNLQRAKDEIRQIDDDIRWESVPKWKAKFKQDKLKWQQKQTELLQMEKTVNAALKAMYSNSSKTAPAGFRKLTGECKQALSAMRSTKTLLYRGMSGDSHQMIGHPRTDRYPRDSSASMQKAFDYALSKMGFKALRSNSIFTTTSYSQASSYGNGVFIIIPKDGFKFTWSPKHGDLILYELPLKTLALAADLKEYLAWFNYYLKPYKTNVSQSDASTLDELKEVILDAIDNAAYHGMDEATADRLRQELEDDPPERLVNPEVILKKFKPTNKDFKAALKSENEIIIKGDYYALDYNKYGKLLSSWVGEPWHGDD